MKFTFRNRVNAGYTFTLTYIKGRLINIEFSLICDRKQLTALMSKIDPQDITATKKELELFWEEIKEAPKKFNVAAAWCNLYQDRYKIAYKMNDRQAGMLNTLGDIQHEFLELVKFFFGLEEWWAKTKDVATFVKYINEIRRLQATPKVEEKQKPKFPLEYNKAFEATLTGQDLSEYWKHLRDNGWQKTQHGWQKIHQHEGEKAVYDLAKKFTGQ
jgi:predicted 3-demethylubiquinone-9 3-methyltransferase (glyoxalase superfamily)